LSEKHSRIADSSFRERSDASVPAAGVGVVEGVDVVTVTVTVVGVAA
jgi:hypothetical protein